MSPTGNPAARGIGNEIAHMSRKFTIFVFPASTGVLAAKPSGVVLQRFWGSLSRSKLHWNRASEVVGGRLWPRSCEKSLGRPAAWVATADFVAAEILIPGGSAIGHPATPLSKFRWVDQRWGCGCSAFASSRHVAHGLDGNGANSGRRPLSLDMRCDVASSTSRQRDVPKSRYSMAA
jgi:hypothetical protein